MYPGNLPSKPPSLRSDLVLGLNISCLSNTWVRRPQHLNTPLQFVLPCSRKTPPASLLRFLEQIGYITASCIFILSQVIHCLRREG
jgi:hypothetical protein